MQSSYSQFAKHATIFALVFLSWQKAYPIGKIGNNSMIGDPAEGFTATIPWMFPSVLSNTTDRSAQLVSNEALETSSLIDKDGAGFDDGIPVSLTMLSVPLATYFANDVSKNPQALQMYLTTKFNFVIRQLASPTCVSLIFGENKVGYIGVAIWGGGHGYVVSVQKTKSDIGRDAILSFLNTTVIGRPCQP